MNLPSAKNILITGANSGIGASLALEYADKNINLFLIARNKERLENIHKSCIKRGANVTIASIDVRDRVKIKNFINKIAKNHSLDLVIANAGISSAKIDDLEEESQIDELIDINIKGVLNVVNAAQKIMMQQNYGQIAIMSSLASFKSVSGAGSYSASKAYVRIYGESLRLHLQKFNIAVNVICPGYIKTPLTDLNNFPMPFLMDAIKAAKIIKNALKKNKARIAFPWQLYNIILLIMILPLKLSDYIFGKLPKYSKKAK